MAVLANTALTLADLASRLEPDNQNIAMIIEMLSQTNDVLPDIPWIEGNLKTGHRSTQRTDLPEAYWRKLYGFVPASKSTTAVIEDSCAMLEAWMEIDPDLADLGGQRAALLMSETRGHVQGMGQTMAQSIFYSNDSLNPEQFLGLSPRFSDLSAENADNIIDAGGTGSDNASIWLIGWGENSIHGIYPQGSNAGLTVTDKGERVQDGPNQGKRRILETHFKWDTGLTVRDWRYAVRICNIDKSELSPDPTTGGANLPRLMFEAVNRIQSLEGVNARWYMSRDVRTRLGQQTAEGTSGSTLVSENVGGVHRTTFDGIPIGRVDALAPDEARVV